MTAGLIMLWSMLELVAKFVRELIFFPWKLGIAASQESVKSVIGCFCRLVKSGKAAFFGYSDSLPTTYQEFHEQQLENDR
jgi:hypothetical protein